MVSGEKRIDLLLLIVAHALVLSGLFCVILTREIPAALWLCALAAHPVSILIKPRQGGLFFNSLVILSFIYALFLFFVLQIPFLVAFTQFLIVVQAVKLFHLQKSKDYFQLAGLSLLMVLAAAGLTTQLYYLFFLFLLLLFGIWFLFLLQLKRAREQHPDLLHPPRSLTSPSLFLGITGVALCSFIITILIFFTLPRITLSVSGRERWGGTSSGFSDIVDLGTVGPVRLDNRVVMRVELPQLRERPAAPLYWRGMSFARWDGQAWAKEGAAEEIPREPGGGPVSIARRAAQRPSIRSSCSNPWAPISSSASTRPWRSGVTSPVSSSIRAAASTSPLRRRTDTTMRSTQPHNKGDNGTGNLPQNRLRYTSNCRKRRKQWLRWPGRSLPGRDRPRKRSTA